MLTQGQFNLSCCEGVFRFITADNIRNNLLDQPSIHFIKKDFLFKSGIWRGVEQKTIFELRKMGNIDRVCIGYSDTYTTILDLTILKLLGVKKIFGTNIASHFPTAMAIPLGLTNDCDDTNLHRMFGNSQLLPLAAADSKISNKFKAQIYANFSLNTNFSVRRELYEILFKLHNSYEIITSQPKMTYSGRFDYLKNLRTSSMVVCPEGNGIDTHRLWETVYMGGIPIVTKNPSMNSLYDLIPVIKINSWYDLSDDAMIYDLWLKAKNFVWDTRVLTASYWSNLICSN